jgi:hypothetical protein
MARHRRRRNDGDEIPYGEWIPAHAVKFNADGTVELMTEASQAHNPHYARRNPELALSKDLFVHPSLHGGMHHVPAGTPVKILEKGGRGRFLVEADLYGTPYYGWVWDEELSA